jgi:hypothetical protein
MHNNIQQRSLHSQVNQARNGMSVQLNARDKVNNHENFDNLMKRNAETNGYFFKRFDNKNHQVFTESPFKQNFLSKIGSGSDIKRPHEANKWNVRDIGKVIP